MKRDAVVKAMVPSLTKDAAADLFSQWGLSLSDAVNVFLTQSVAVGGFPFEIRMPPARPCAVPSPESLGVAVVGKVDEGGHAVWAAEEYCEEDDAYDAAYPAL